MAMHTYTHTYTYMYSHTRAPFQVCRYRPNAEVRRRAIKAYNKLKTIFRDNPCPPSTSSSSSRKRPSDTSNGSASAATAAAAESRKKSRREQTPALNLNPTLPLEDPNESEEAEQLVPNLPSSS